MIETRFESLELPAGKVPFGPEALFRQLRSELADLQQE